MTAQLKPVSVTILLGTLLVSKGDGSCEAPTEETTRLWINQVSDAVFEFSGVIDKECANHIVAMWIGREAGIIAHHAVKAARKIKELTKALTKELRGPKLMAKQILTSGGGLTGVYVGSQLPDGEKFTILGDQLTNIFQLEEGVEVLKQDIIICPSTAELVKKFFNLEESAIKDPQSSVNAQIKMYVVP